MTRNDEGADHLRTLLLDRMQDEPPPPPVSELLRACERSHRSRRRRLSVAALVAVAPVAVVGFLVHERPVAVSTTDLGAMSDSELLSRCRNGNQSDEATEHLFDPGTPTVIDKATVAEMSTVILLSADGGFWAHCFINHYAGAEFSSGMTVYDASGTSRGIGYSAGFTCKDLDAPPARACDTFMVDYVDRLPEVVGSVDFTTSDGQTTRIPTTADGFVLFTYTGEVPDGYSKVDYSVSHLWLTRITYIDRGGDPLAAANTGSSDPDEMRVGVLPLLGAYPSRRGPMEP